MKLCRVDVGMLSVRFSFMVLLVFLISTGKNIAQRDEEKKYDKEIIYGVTKATNSGVIGGFLFKFNRKLNENSFHGFSFEMVNIKHPQEQRLYSSVGKGAILGKQNYLYSLRFSYHREKVFFRKANVRGVQMNGVFNLGPTIGLEAPYYVEIALSDGNTKKEPFDLEKHLGSGGGIIVGPGNILQGVGESSVVMGLNTKFGLVFEFGTFKSDLAGVEIGFQTDFFTRKIILLPTAENFSIFPSGYITLFFGFRK